MFKIWKNGSKPKIIQYEKYLDFKCSWFKNVQISINVQNLKCSKIECSYLKIVPIQKKIVQI
jgi:hypothetical protein